MDKIQRQQKEAIEVEQEYIIKVKNGIKDLIELYKEECNNTDREELLNKCLDALNLIIEICNGTKDIMESNNIIIHKENINSALQNLSQALQLKNDKDIAVCLECDILPMLKDLHDANRTLLFKVS